METYDPNRAALLWHHILQQVGSPVLLKGERHAELFGAYGWLANEVVCCSCRRNAYRTLTHLQPVPFCVRRATATDVNRLLALQDDCCMRIQVQSAKQRPHDLLRCLHRDMNCEEAVANASRVWVRGSCTGELCSK